MKAKIDKTKGRTVLTVIVFGIDLKQSHPCLPRKMFKGHYSLLDGVVMNRKMDKNRYLYRK
jgi:hypothetical protein